MFQEFRDQQEVYGLFSLVAVLDGSCEQWVWWEEAKCQALHYTSSCIVRL